MANTKIPAELSSTPSISDSGDATAITIDSSEKVGIGAAPTLGALHVTSSLTDIVTFENTDAGTTGAQLILYHNSSSPADGDRVGALNFKGQDDAGNDTTYAGIRCLATDVSNTTEDGTLTFSTTRAGTFTEAMRIDESGNVGIGTTSPSFPLSVTSSSGTAAEFLGEGGPHGLRIYGNDGGFGAIGHVSSGSYDLAIDSSGNVGIGTSSPAGLLTIAGSGDAIRIESSNSGSGGAQMDMLHFSSSPADGDVHGVINFGGYYSGSSSSYGSTIKSVWTDVSAQQARLEFWTRNGSDYLQRFRIDHLGQLFAFTLTGSGASNPNLRINTGSGYIYYDSSSLRYKENIQDFPNSLNVVKELRPVTFDDKVLQEPSFGLVAEEVNEIAPELVTYKEIDGEEKPETVVYDKLTIHLLKAIQEQQTIIEDLKARIETLEG